MRTLILTLSSVAFVLASYQIKAQDTSKLFLTTGVGVITGVGQFSKAISPSLAFNSGIELKLSNKWFAQVQIDFNSLKYDQQIKDNNSPYLFRGTNSSLLVIGINSGYNINLASKWFVSVYTGAGLVNVGEPRVNFDNVTLIATQSIIRKTGFFGRAGARLAYRTNSKLLQTVFADVSYWGSPLKVQGGNVKGLSVYLGTRFGI